jgi:hypothetical protein
MVLNIPLFQKYSLSIQDTLAGNITFPTGHLQKGFLLLDDGNDLSEEAVGFGVPILKKGLETIFPGSATISWVQKGATYEITAIYKLNLKENFSNSGIVLEEHRLLYAAKNILAATIRRFPIARGLLTLTSNLIRQLFRWETVYTNAGYGNEVQVDFLIESETGGVTMEIDTSRLPPDVSEIILMNEQGAHVFDEYQDSSGLRLRGKEIGCWDEVSAHEAWFESTTHAIAFRLGQVKGARLFRGREEINSRLAWSGFGYSFTPSLPRMRFNMQISKIP